MSGEVLTEEGHHWIGLDISQAMLGTSSNSVFFSCKAGNEIFTMVFPMAKSERGVGLSLKQCHINCFAFPIFHRILELF